MSLTVNTNMASMNAINNLSKTTRDLSGSFSRISSGLRIVSAVDDAAGLGVAENLDASYRSAMQAMRNTNDGISIVQVGEGAANEVGNMLKRMRELAMESASETLADDERAYIQDEYEQLASEVDRIASVTDFNGVQLTDGSNTGLDVQVGIRNTLNDRINIELGDLRSTSLGVSTTDIDLSSATAAQAALDAIDTAIDSVNQYRSTFGAIQSRLESTLNNLEVFSENTKSAESRIRDADYAFETAELSKLQIMQQAGIAVLGQANILNQGTLSLLA